MPQDMLLNKSVDKVQWVNTDLYTSYGYRNDDKTFNVVSLVLSSHYIFSSSFYICLFT